MFISPAPWDGSGGRGELTRVDDIPGHSGQEYTIDAHRCTQIPDRISGQDATV
jgi:hypothetical protein